MSTHPVATSMQQILAWLETRYFERNDALEAMALAVLCGEHVYILGPPGTGKSDMVGDFVRCFTDARYFKTSMSRTRPAQALLGPQDMAAIKQSKWIRHGDGYLQTSEFAFIDEIGKMSPIVGHDLLSILLEREYHEVDNGRSIQPVPLHTAFTASNELIVNESDDAAALWDRLLLRTTVDYIVERSSFAKLFDRPETPEPCHIAYADLHDVTNSVLPKIAFDNSIITALAQLKDKCAEEGIVISTRRWRKCKRILQAAAFLEGREHVEEDDITVLRHVLWEQPEHIEAIARLCLAQSSAANARVTTLTAAMEKIKSEVFEREGQARDATTEYAVEANDKLTQAKAELMSLAEQARTAGKSTTQIDRALALHKDVQTEIFVRMLGMPRDVAERGAA